MNKLLYTFLLITTSFIVFSQESCLIEFIPSTCDRTEDVYRLRERISDIYSKGDLTYIHVSVIANCGYRSKYMNGNAFVKNDSLFLSFSPKNVNDTVIENGDTIISEKILVEFCKCCFSYLYILDGNYLDLKIITLNNRLIEFHPDKYLIFPIKFDEYMGDTINLVDKHGFKQKRWLKHDEEGRVLSERYYSNDSIIKGLDVKYDDLGRIRLKVEWQNDDYEYYYLYDKDGNEIKKEKGDYDFLR